MPAGGARIFAAHRDHASDSSEMRADGLASTDSSTEQVDAQGLQDHLSDWDATPVPSSHAVKVAFGKVDTNRDGVIDESEWSAAAPPTGDAAGSAVDFNPIQRRAQQARLHSAPPTHQLSSISQ